MKFNVNFEMDESKQQDSPAKKPETRGTNDVWRFGEIRETLWGKGSPVQPRPGIWDLSGIRKTLWGK